MFVTRSLADPGVPAKVKHLIDGFPGELRRVDQPANRVVNRVCGMSCVCVCVPLFGCVGLSV